MLQKSVRDPAFAKYGFVVEGYDFAPLLDTLRDTTPCPTDAVIYEPTGAALEALPIFTELQNNLYGGMPIQIGYCNGANHLLNCLEYHRGSELNVAADDVILLLAPLGAVQDGQLDTDTVEAFVLPTGTGIVLYETTLHYAPCSSAEGAGFRVIITLPRDTNTAKPEITVKNAEDRLLWAKNKWLIAHPDTTEAKQGAFVGLRGENLRV